MDYTLKITKEKISIWGALRKFLPLLKDDTKRLVIAFVAIIVNSGLTLLGPLLIGLAINKYIETKNVHGLLVYTGLVFAVYTGAFISQYIQTKTMGGVGQRLLYSLRNTVFNKLQSLPIAFFNQNKAGDLISRINNDTDNLNQFFSQSLMQFLGSIFIVVGAAIFILCINIRLGLATLIPLAIVLVVTQILSPWVKRENAKSLQEVGGMSAEIQESLGNFKVIVAFNRRDYFRKKFEGANYKNFITSVWAGVANNIFLALYTLASSAAQLIVLVYGIHLILIGNFTLGFLVSYIAYVSRLYDPLRQMASLWSTFETALASWGRITAILSMENNIAVLPNQQHISKEQSVLVFKDVGFTYHDGKTVLNDVTLRLEPGKTYALVGPTGGGKTTTASLMARLYDPTVGTVTLEGADIRSINNSDRSKKIGFILQEPFLFTGTVGQNIFYGNPDYEGMSDEEKEKALHQAGLAIFLQQFEKGLDTPVMQSGESISLGQRQLVAFMRAVIRKPDIIILDEATANIDTVTERLLEEVIQQLPSHTTKVIIAHRLNTIQTADEIYFVNNGTVTSAGSFDHAVEMLLHAKRTS